MSTKSLFSKKEKQEVLRITATTKGLHVVGPITYPSGNRGPFNVDNAKVVSDPKRLEAIGTILARGVKKLPIEAVVAIPTLGLPLATTASRKAHIPLLWVRPQADPRTGELLEGAWKKGMRVALIDDVIAAAGTKKRAIQHIGPRLRVTDIVCLWGIDEKYKPNFRPWAKKHKIRVHYLFDWTELEYYSRSLGALHADCAGIQLTFLRNPVAWGTKKHLETLQQFKRKYRLTKGESF
ncbi:MAG: hypothetical protein V1685_02165 [Parcubacteria group bacterium]